MDTLGNLLQGVAMLAVLVFYFYLLGWIINGINSAIKSRKMLEKFFFDGDISDLTLDDGIRAAIRKAADAGVSRDQVVKLVKEELNRYDAKPATPRRHPIYDENV